MGKFAFLISCLADLPRKLSRSPAGVPCRKSHKMGKELLAMAQRSKPFGTTGLVAIAQIEPKAGVLSKRLSPATGEHKRRAGPGVPYVYLYSGRSVLSSKYIWIEWTHMIHLECLGLITKMSKSNSPTEVSIQPRSQSEYAAVASYSIWSSKRACP